MDRFCAKQLNCSDCKVVFAEMPSDMAAIANHADTPGASLKTLTFSAAQSFWLQLGPIKPAARCNWRSSQGATRCKIAHHLRGRIV